MTPKRRTPGSSVRHPTDDEILAAFQVALKPLADGHGRHRVTESDWCSICGSLLEDLVDRVSRSLADFTQFRAPQHDQVLLRNSSKTQMCLLVVMHMYF